MIDPVETLQTTIRGTLISDPGVTGLIDAESIRSGSSIPPTFPCVIMSDPQTVNLGRTAGGQLLTRVYLDLHIWCLDQAANTATHIGAALTNALWDMPEGSTLMIQEWVRPDFRYMRDPDPDKAYRHGVGTVEAVIMWRP
ncbi:tail completion protein gp17 [Tateyamaria sp. SN3-11]|uniref:tail completion protein gp17 n=1 Tax=Tateyamaria sp. SN3-11 TaxID=3092147 RepID=UPI0039E74DED